MHEIAEKVRKGLVLRKKKTSKEYVVIGYDIVCGGNAMEISAVRTGHGVFKVVHLICDCNFDDYEIVEQLIHSK
jgi:hypothetical protein